MTILQLADCLAYGVLAGLAAEIVRVFVKAYRRTRDHWVRLLPLHVLGIVASYLGIGLWALYHELNDDNDRGSWTLLAMYVIGVTSLVVLMNYERRRSNKEVTAVEVGSKLWGRRRDDRPLYNALPVYIAVVVTLLVGTTSITTWQSTKKLARENRERVATQARIQAGACLRANRSDGILRTLVIGAIGTLERPAPNFPESQRRSLLALYQKQATQLAPQECPAALGPIIKETDDRLDAALYAECQRVNRLRAQSNTNAEVTFRKNLADAKRELELASAGGPDAAVHRASARQIIAQSRRLRHTALTNCRQAVYEPQRYAPPTPRPFSAPQ